MEHCGNGQTFGVCFIILICMYFYNNKRFVLCRLCNDNEQMIIYFLINHTPVTPGEHIFKMF